MTFIYANTRDAIGATGNMMVSMPEIWLRPRNEVNIRSTWLFGFNNWPYVISRPQN